MGVLRPLLALCLLWSSLSWGANARTFRLETIEIIGTERITVAQIRDELELYEGTHLEPDVVMGLREKLLGLGLFKSVLLYMRKGSSPGMARLIIEAEDDDTVLGPWAIGSEIAITGGEPRASSLSPSDPSLGYRTSIVARNLLSQGHRASIGADIDSETVLREGYIAYGLPRFAKESAQFDARFQATDVSHRYLNAMGFGQRGEAYWTQDREEGSIRYGVAMYLNRGQRFDLPNFPTTIAGPKIGLFKDERLLSFIPSAGIDYGLSVVIPPFATDRYVIEMQSGLTSRLGPLLSGSIDAKIMTIGTTGLTTRFEAKLDMPVGRSEHKNEFAKIFIRLNAGSDRFDNTNLVGSSATIGLRYHSPGFIGELALKFTKIPKDIEPLLSPPRSGGSNE